MEKKVETSVNDDAQKTMTAVGEKRKKKAQKHFWNIFYAIKEICTFKNFKNMWTYARNKALSN